MIELRKAIMRYLYRRSEITKLLDAYFKNSPAEDVSIPAFPFAFPEDGVTAAQMGIMLDKNEKFQIRMGRELKKASLMQAMDRDKELFYLCDEFMELQKVIGECEKAYRELYIKFNRQIKGFPSSLMAGLMRMEAAEGMDR